MAADSTQHIRRRYDGIDGDNVIVEADVRTDDSGKRVIENLTQSGAVKGGVPNG